jgi:hypothetical protein
VLIVGGLLSIPLLRSYGNALRQAGNRVIYLGCFNNPREVYCQPELESAADLIIWSMIHDGHIQPGRPQDYTEQGDALEVLLRYARGKCHPHKTHPEIPLTEVDRIYLIGEPELLRHFQAARKTLLKPFLLKEPLILGSVYSTMQCMLKGVCAQCLQWQIDPETGQRTKAVFACSWPEQPLECIDVDNIEERQSQNRLQEYLSHLWVDYLFEQYSIMRI